MLAKHAGQDCSGSGLGKIGRVVLLTDSTSALGKLVNRLDVTKFVPDARQARRWLSWLSWVNEYEPADVTFFHIGGTQNQLADLLSRLVDNGRQYMPEGKEVPVALLAGTGSSSGQSQIPPPEILSIFSSEGFLGSVAQLQRSDEATVLFGLSLRKWHQYLDGDDGSSLNHPLAKEAEKLGLVARQRGVIQVYGDVDLSDGVWVPVIPEGRSDEFYRLVRTNCEVTWDIRTWVLFCFHELASHQAPWSMKSQIVRLAWFPRLAKACRLWVDKCDQCMDTKTAGRLAMLTAPRVPRGLIDGNQRMKHLTIDHGFPSKDWLSPNDPDLTCFLVITDSATGYCVVAGAPSTTTEVTLKLLWDRWVAYFGIPLSLMSDNALDSQMMRHSLAATAIQYLPVPAWSPFSNGLAEVRVKRLKQIVSVMELPWDEALWYAQMTVNSAARASGASAAELVMGSRILTPSEALVGAMVQAEEMDGTTVEVDPSTADPTHIKEVVTRLLDRERVTVLETRLRESVRRVASGRGHKKDVTDLEDGTLVVWRRPGALDVEGHVVKVQTVDVNSGPYVYLGRMAGFSTRLRPLGSISGKTIAVSPCHLEPRREEVDRTRATPSVEGTVNPAKLRDGDCVLVRLLTGADVLGLYAGPSIDDQKAEGRVHVLDSEDGRHFYPVYLNPDGTTLMAETPPQGATALLRSFSKVMASLKLTSTRLLSKDSRETLVTRGYLSG
ncbi:hypothetical protein Pmar_PMAR017053 [Perkinsus marinus ATCC 50983]|uniref:Integrase catalytic domain-containing protein n=1 Tax=Perkinsus marinus (strain ATCC 50983 / TXsc) TaxID=423536 RepID=C5LSF4_PERM5|nr:hypothetical protein Pmar_PMAR017053 [Perkinsus marinus ATCC 50983]EER00195.1 hypothetical protein Pmar_PMAR017053 [Perkinsus marinus ATCC 50983]|eukprot:XP_002767477.1 hypothetical protein Pmar_PMAR017053 [Perkinsus marinus ATCC 50983]